MFSGLFLRVSSCACSGTGAFGGSSVDGPIMTMPAYTLEKGKFVVNTSINYQNYDEFTLSQMKEINRNRLHAHSRSANMQIAANLLYGLTDDLTVIVSYPFQSNFNLQYTYDGFTYDEDDSIGLGDMSLMLKYHLPEIKKLNLDMALIAGIEMPTGFTNERDKTGIPLAADHQPGSGSWDPLLGAAFSKRFASERLEDISLHSNLLYKLSTKGSQDTVVGDIVNFNFAANYLIDRDSPNKFQKLFPRELLGTRLDWSLVSEINGIWLEKTEYSGIKDNAHGGLLVNWMNGLKLAIEEQFIIGLLAGFPLIDDLNGTSPDAGFNLIGTMGFVF